MKGRVGAVLLVGFCCWHAVFLIASIVPRNTAGDALGNGVPNFYRRFVAWQERMMPDNSRRIRALNFYRLLVSGDQQWNMFETIPTLHSFDTRIEVDDGRGGRTTLGSMMPGFTPYPHPEDARYYNLFYRMLQGSDRSPQFLAYLRRTEGLLNARYGNAIAGHWKLVVDVEWTRDLSQSSRDGGLYVPAVRFFDTAHLGGIAP